MIPVVILNYNTPDDVITCIDSFETRKWETRLSHFYIVVDSGSSKGNWQQLDKLLTKYNVFKLASVDQIIEKELITDGMVIHYRSEENLGYSRGNNIGFRFLARHHFEVGILANPDTRIVDTGSIKKLSTVIEENPEVLAAFPEVLGPDDRFTGNNQGPFPVYNDFYLFLYCGFFGWLIERPWAFLGKIRRAFHLRRKNYYPIYTSIGCFYAISVPLFQNVGFFDEEFFLYLEEQVLAEKARASGYKVVMVHDAKIKHEHHYTASAVASKQYDISLDLFLRKYRKFGKNKTKLYYTIQRSKNKLKKIINCKK